MKTLRDAGEDVIDLGTNSSDPVDYPDYAAGGRKRGSLDGRAERGILICGSGAGAAMAANKMHGIRAGSRPRYVHGPPDGGARRHERLLPGSARDRPGAGGGD